MTKQYTETDLGVLVAGDWSLVNSEGAVVKPGVGVRASQREKLGPWNYPQEVVLPFPFTLNQFRAFCDWHTYFQWEVIEALYLNEDGSLDEDALAELAQRGEEAAELVRRYLTGDTDATTAVSQPPTVNHADAPAAPPNGQQDAPKRNRRTWFDVSSGYIVMVMKTGQYTSAKQLFVALEKKAGPDSPFDKGTGDNRGNLFVREIAQSLKMKTVQNEWERLRELAQK